MEKKNVLNVNSGTKLTFYLEFWETCNIVVMYLWVVTIKIKCNKSVRTTHRKPFKIIYRITHSPNLFIYLFLIWISINEKIST